jgi:peroxiredoxin Q/BCP
MEGQQIPTLTLKNQSGRHVNLSSLKGKKIILYFYPKDMTPGCTVEACEFRDLNSEMKKKNAIIFGVSLDSEESHQKFISKHNLNFDLLVDEGGKLAREFDAYGKKNIFGHVKEGVKRTTVIIDEAGKVKKIFRNVNPLGHSQEVLKELS